MLAPWYPRATAEELANYVGGEAWNYNRVVNFATEFAAPFVNTLTAEPTNVQKITLLLSGNSSIT